MTRRGAFPGSFNPPTVAHLAIATAALEQCRLDRLDLVLSRRPLGKARVDRPSFDDRVGVLRRAAAEVPGLDVVVTDAVLIADIARGYDVVVVGADKWAQMLDPSFYRSASHQAEALAALPEVVVVPRAGFDPPGAAALALPGDLAGVSSSAVRAGTLEWMAPAAAAFDRETGAWSEPARYDAWASARSRPT